MQHHLQRACLFPGFHQIAEQCVEVLRFFTQGGGEAGSGGDVPRQFDHQLAHGALLEPFANYLQRLQKRHARLDQRR